MISYCLNCCLIVWSVTINQWLPRRTFELFTESSMLCCCCCWALFWPDELGYNSALHNHAGNVPEAITKHAAGLLLRGTEVEGRQQWRRHNGGAVWDRDSDRLRTGWEQGPSPDQRLCCSVLWEVAHCEGCLCQEDHLRECPFLALGGLQPLQVWHCSPCPEQVTANIWCPAYSHSRHHLIVEWLNFAAYDAEDVELYMSSALCACLLLVSVS